MSPEGYLLKANYRNNTITGWIKPEDLPSGIDPAIFAQARKNQAHRDAVAVAVANKTVVQGMTPDDVKQSVGRPESVTSHSDPNGESLVWTYTTYREDPQYQYALDSFGRPGPADLLRQDSDRPDDHLVRQRDVVSVEQHKTDPNSSGVVTN